MSEVLSQSQIDALLNAVRSGEKDMNEQKEDQGEKKYRKYDFYSPKKFTRDKLRLLRGIYENYARVVSSRLNSVLRTACQVDIQHVEEQRYYEFTNSLNENDVLTLVSVTTEAGTEKEPVVMRVDVPVMLAMIDHMLGGTGEEDDDIAQYALSIFEKVCQ